MGAIFLIAAGGLAVAGLRVGVWLHLVWAVMRLVLICVEVFLSVRLFNSSQAYRGTQPLQPFDLNAGQAGLVNTVMIQLACPFILLSVLPFATLIRAYFRAGEPVILNSPRSGHQQTMV